MSSIANRTVLDLDASLPLATFPRVRKLLRIGLEHVLAVHSLNTLYRTLPESLDTRHFLEHAVDALGIHADVCTAALDRVPRAGPAIVTANYALGPTGGLVLARLLTCIRPDVRILVDYRLDDVPEIAGLLISLDPAAGGRNLRPLREALRWVTGGGLLVTFPGAASTGVPIRRTGGSDGEWTPSVGRLVRMTGAPVLPMHLAGERRPSRPLAVRLDHPRVRAALLPRELLECANSRVRLRVGTPITHAMVRGLGNDAEIARYLRLRTHLLAEAGMEAANAPCSPRPDPVPVAAPIAPALLRAEVEALPADQLLAEAGHLQVRYARAGQIPWCLQEIGRLRETTFRAVGEGTGRVSDVDLYDAWYLHLFAWDTRAGEIVGAYRLGLTDEILARHGPRGLYTHSLFRYGAPLVRRVDPGIELGRSFVRAEHQKTFAPLMLLWRGIGEFVARHPRYAMLFGPVSISNAYGAVSRQLMVEYLTATCAESSLARHVRPRHPFRARRKPALREPDLRCVKDIEDLSRLVAEVEADGKGVPILIKHYLRLGGRLLGFSNDAQFGDALDGLILVDLRRSPPRSLARHMGEAGAATFLAHHAGGSAAAGRVGD